MIYDSVSGVANVAFWIRCKEHWENNIGSNTKNEIAALVESRRNILPDAAAPQLIFLFNFIFITMARRTGTALRFCRWIYLQIVARLSSKLYERPNKTSGQLRSHKP